MRCVDYCWSEIPLADEVDEVRQQLVDAPNGDERADMIHASRHIWAQIKPTLACVFHGKCWYTESPQQGTDVDVDHFRPKGRVAESRRQGSVHPGYWWLAFSPENFRYSCIVSNRRRRDTNTGIVGGKADHFPLWNEAKRAWTPDCDWSEEEPLFLDPCKAGEVGLITFREDGEAMPRVSALEGKKAYCRADTSIKYYHLNHSDFVKARIKLRDEMTRFVQAARKTFNKLESADATNAGQYDLAISHLRRMRSEKAPYSSFCVAYLDRLRNEPFLAGVFL